MTKIPLPVLNLETARFKCVYPTCGGACCRESRPPIAVGEANKIRANLERFLPQMRPAARRLAAKGGWLTKRMKSGMHTLAIVDHYCVFYSEGCVLHKVGAAAGNKNEYKPGTCITFPLDRDDDDRWYIRQHGQPGEEWSELPCLSPEAAPDRAADSLREEIEFAERVEAGLEDWREAE